MAKAKTIEKIIQGKKITATFSEMPDSNILHLVKKILIDSHTKHHANNANKLSISNIAK